MADLFKKKNAEEVPVAVEASADAPAPEQKAKKEKKQKVKYLEPNKMNFLEQYEIVVEGKKKNLDLAKILKPMIAVAVVVLAIFVLLEVVLLGMKARNKSLEKYINDDANVASYSEAVATKEETDQVNAQKANLETCMAAIDSYPNVDNTFFNTIANCATKNGVTISSISYSSANGSLSCVCNATTTAGISQFVRDMEACGLFASTTYDSFSGDDNGYSFSFSTICLGDAAIQAPTTEAPTEAVTE